MAPNDQLLELIADEVAAAVREHGELGATEIKEAWALSDSRYGELKELTKRRHPDLTAGPQRIGGFRAKAEQSIPPPIPGVEDNIVFTTDWENAAVNRLTETLSHASLEKHLGPLVRTVRVLRRLRTGKDRRGTKRELAAALLLRYGRDIFTEKAIRDEVGQVCKLPAPGRWHPGKGQALRWVRSAGFPLELAGEPIEDDRTDYEVIESIAKLNPLRDFQLEVLRKLHRVMESSSGRAILTLPTGGGKTRVAVEAVRDWYQYYYDDTLETGQRLTVLWLAHTEELCEQAYLCFREVWQQSPGVPPLLLVRFWGAFTRDLGKHEETLQAITSHPAVLISTPHRIANLIKGRIGGSEELLHNLTSGLGVLVIDEAHHAAAASYRTIIDHLAGEGSQASIIGLTATPFRTEYSNNQLQGTRELQRIFRQLIEPTDTLGPDAKRALQELGILAKPIARTLHTGITLRCPPKSLEEFTSDAHALIDRALAQHADRAERRTRIFDYLLPLAREEGRSILYFGPSVRDAECMAYMLRAEGISSTVLSASTRDSTRREAVRRFRDKQIRVLCSCEILTTGFDAPQVSHAVIARPTVSRVLYEQMVGRALRGPLFGGTEHAEIIDCVDKTTGPRPRFGYEQFRQVWSPDQRDM